MQTKIKDKKQELIKLEAEVEELQVKIQEPSEEENQKAAELQDMESTLAKVREHLEKCNLQGQCQTKRRSTEKMQCNKKERGSTKTRAAPKQ